MITVTDHKGKTYWILEAGICTTLLQCVASGDRIRLPSNGWDQIGFSNVRETNDERQRGQLVERIHGT